MRLLKECLQRLECARQMVKKWYKYEDVSLWAILRCDYEKGRAVDEEE